MMPAYQLFKSSFERDHRDTCVYSSAVAATTVDLLTERINPDAETARHIAYIIRRARSPEDANEELAQQGYPVRLGWGPNDILRKGAAGGYVDGDGILHFPPAVQKQPGLERIVRHELVHNEQVRKMGPQAHQQAMRKFERDRPKKGLEAYYGDPHELMAQARTAADDIAAQYPAQQRLELLRSGALKTQIAQAYRNMPAKIRNRFLRTVYGYVQQDLKESVEVPEGQVYDVKPGDRVWFEYHCYEGHDSADAHLWYRSHTPVTVVRMVEPGAGRDMQERGYNGHSAVFKVRFDDGHEDDATEDELFHDKSEFFRPDPPTPPPGAQRVRENADAKDFLLSGPADTAPVRTRQGDRETWHGLRAGTADVFNSGSAPVVQLRPAAKATPEDLKVFIKALLRKAHLTEFAMTVFPEWEHDPERFPVMAALNALDQEGYLSHVRSNGRLWTFEVRSLKEAGDEGAKGEIMGAFDIDSAHVARQFEEVMNRNFGPGFVTVKDYSHPARLENAHDLALDFKVDPGEACPSGRRGTALIRSRGTQVLRAMVKKLGFRTRNLYTSLNHQDGIDFSIHFGIPEPGAVEQKKRWLRIRRRLGEADDIKAWLMSEEPPRNREFEMFFGAYLEAALWSSSGGVDPEHPDGNPKYENLDNFSYDDIEPESMARMRQQALEFFEKTQQFYDTTEKVARAGHDLWLTQAGHGAGFWDGDWDYAEGEEPVEGIHDLGEHLTELAKQSGEITLDVGTKADGTEYVHAL